MRLGPRDLDGLDRREGLPDQAGDTRIGDTAAPAVGFDTRGGPPDQRDDENERKEYEEGDRGVDAQHHREGGHDEQDRGGRVGGERGEVRHRGRVVTEAAQRLARRLGERPRPWLP